MDGLLSKTASDAINIASFVTGVLSLGVGLVALALTYYLRPKGEIKTSRGGSRADTPSLRAEGLATTWPKLKRFLYVEGALLAASTVFFLPVGPIRNFLAIPAFLLWLTQGVFAVILLFAVTTEAFDNPGVWRYWYTVSLSIVLLATTLVLWPGATTPLREFLGFQLILPAVMSGCGLVVYVAWLICESLGSYFELRRKRKPTSVEQFYQQQVEKLSREKPSTPPSH